MPPKTSNASVINCTGCGGVLTRPGGKYCRNLKMAAGGEILVDNFLCFGCKAAPFIFNRLTDSICRYLRDVGIESYNYLDDRVCLAESYEQGVQDQLFVIKLLRQLGFYIACQKVSSPSR